MTATETIATTVQAGQEITEVETPDGPWYSVVKVNRKSLVVAIDADDPEAGTVRIPISDSHLVLARTAA